MQLYRLTLATIIQRKVWFLALSCAGLLPLVLPYMTPYEGNPTLIEPARAQAAWGCLWTITLLWVFFQAARFGEDNSRSGLGAYFLSRGISHMRQLMQIWLACLSFVLPLAGLCLAVCFLGAMPGDDAQAAQWVSLNLQYLTLYLLSILPLVLLAVAVGSRVGGTVGFLLPLSLLLYGVYGVGYMEMLADSRESAILDWLYVFSPHYHLADLTWRLVFKLGAMETREFFVNASYLAGMGMVWTAMSIWTFRAKSLA